MGLFSLVRHTGNTLIRMAKERGVKVAAPELLEPGKRFRSKGLSALEANVFRTTRRASCPASGAVLYEAKDLYDEAEYVACLLYTSSPMIYEKAFPKTAEEPSNFMDWIFPLAFI